VSSDMLSQLHLIRLTRLATNQVEIVVEPYLVIEEGSATRYC
jgi:hypothetical protein